MVSLAEVRERDGEIQEHLSAYSRCGEMTNAGAAVGRAGVVGDPAVVGVGGRPGEDGLMGVRGGWADMISTDAMRAGRIFSNDSEMKVQCDRLSEARCVACRHDMKGGVV